MTDREALLRAVCENPEDDLPRLVFADWLEDHDEPERARFIRVQVEFAQLAREGRGANPELRRIDREIWRGHGQRWRAELPRIQGVEWFSEFFRGFVERVDVASDSLLVERETDILFAAPIQHLVVHDFRGRAGFSDLDALRHLKTLSVFIKRSTNAAIDELLRCDQFRDSLWLDVSSIGTQHRRYPELKRKFVRQLYAPFRAPSG
jgi:uncharacterized protein (TIGR02996 family)